MSESDKAVVTHRIKENWPGEWFTTKRGYVKVSQVRDGGLTARLIEEAAEVADRYYKSKLRGILSGPDSQARLQDWANDR